MFEKKIVFLENLPPLRFDDVPEDTAYTSAQKENFSAIYLVDDIYNFNSNVIGDARYDTKIVFAIGGVSLTYTGVIKAKTDCGCHDVFAYISGTRKYQLTSEGKTVLDYKNVVVDKLVVGDKTYNKATYKATYDPKINKLVVTIEY